MVSSRIKLALVWPLHLVQHPVMVGGTAGAVYLVTGALPWQVGWQEGVRGYAIGAVMYYLILLAQTEDEDVREWVAQLPPFVKNLLGF